MLMFRKGYVKKDAFAKKNCRVWTASWVLTSWFLKGALLPRLRCLLSNLTSWLAGYHCVSVVLYLCCRLPLHMCFKKHDSHQSWPSKVLRVWSSISVCWALSKQPHFHQCLFRFICVCCLPPNIYYITSMTFRPATVVWSSEPAAGRSLSARKAEHTKKGPLTLAY